MFDLEILHLKKKHHTITYLYLKASISYNKHLPPASPAHVDFHNKHVESITFPNKIGEGMYPKSLKITNCIPNANAFSSSATDLE